MLIHMGVCGIGLGHASRSLVVARELLRRGHEIQISTYGEAIDYFRRHGLEPNQNFPVSYSTGTQGEVSIKTTIANNILMPLVVLMQTAKEYQMLHDGVDVVYSDTRASTILASKTMGKPVVTMLNEFNIPLEAPKYPRLASFTESIIQAPQKIWEMSDVIIIPDLPEPYTISIRTLNLTEKAREKAEYVGPVIEEKHYGEEELSEARRELGVDEDEHLVFLHISGPPEERRTLTNKLVEIIPQLGNPCKFVLSRGNPYGREVTRKDNMIIYDWVEDADKLIAVSNLVIARGGLTIISKCIKYGTPMLTIPIPRHGEQLGNAIRVEELGIGKMLREEVLSRATLQDTLETLLEGDMFRRNLLKIKKIVDSLGGVAKIVTTIEEMAK